MLWSDVLLFDPQYDSETLWQYLWGKCQVKSANETQFVKNNLDLCDSNPDLSHLVPSFRRSEDVLIEETKFDELCLDDVQRFPDRRMNLTTLKRHLEWFEKGMFNCAWKPRATGSEIVVLVQRKSLFIKNEMGSIKLKSWLFRGGHLVRFDCPHFGSKWLN